MGESCKMFLFVLIVFMTIYSANAQFFTKIANSVPRMGRRSNPNLPSVVRHVARTLRFVIDMVEDNDQDGNGELNVEELMDIPFIQTAVRNYLDERELRSQYTFESGEREKEVKPYAEKRRLDERMIM